MGHHNGWGGKRHLLSKFDNLTEMPRLHSGVLLSHVTSPPNPFPKQYTRCEVCGLNLWSWSSNTQDAETKGSPGDSRQPGLHSEILISNTYIHTHTLDPKPPFQNRVLVFILDRINWYNILELESWLLSRCDGACLWSLYLGGTDK